MLYFHGPRRHYITIDLWYNAFAKYFIFNLGGETALDFFCLKSRVAEVCIMGRNKKAKDLNVYLNGAKVGNLKKDPSGLFAISQSLPIQEQEYKGEIVSRFF